MSDVHRLRQAAQVLRDRGPSAEWEAGAALLVAVADAAGETLPDIPVAERATDLARAILQQ